MISRMFSALVALTFAAGFLGWIKSQTRSPEQTRMDEILSASTIFPSGGKKMKASRQSVAEALR